MPTDAATVSGAATAAHGSGTVGGGATGRVAAEETGKNEEHPGVGSHIPSR